MNHRIRDELVAEIEHKKQLQNEIDQLKQQLEESKAGLLAAARISDQLEISQVTNSALKEERKRKRNANEQNHDSFENNEISYEFSAVLTFFFSFGFLLHV